MTAEAKIETCLLPIADIFRSDRNRKPEGIEGLAKSISQVGLLQPIGVRKRPAMAIRKGAQHETYEVVWGERRLEACRSLKWETIPAVLVDSVHFASMSTIENAQREPLAPSQEGVVVHELVEAFARTIDPKGESPRAVIRAVAERIGKTPEWVAARLSIKLELAPAVRDLVDAGRLTLQHAAVLARVADAPEQLKLAARAARAEDGTGGKPVGWLRQVLAAADRKISSAPWDPKAAIATLPPCEGCLYNSASRPAGLFPSDEDYDHELDPICGNKECWGKKSKIAAKVVALTVDRATAIKDVKAEKSGLNKVTRKAGSLADVALARQQACAIGKHVLVPAEVVRESVVLERIKHARAAKAPAPAKVKPKVRKRELDPSVLAEQKAWDAALDKYEAECTRWAEGVMAAAGKSKDRTLKACLALALFAESIEFGPGRKYIYDSARSPVLKPYLLQGAANELLSAALDGKLSRVAELAKIDRVCNSSPYVLVRTNVPDRVSAALGGKLRPERPALLDKPRPGAQA